MDSYERFEAECKAPVDLNECHNALQLLINADHSFHIPPRLDDADILISRALRELKEYRHPIQFRDRHKYQCVECEHIFNGHPIKQDGTSCPLCNSYASPIGYADPALDKKTVSGGLKITVDIRNTDLFIKLLKVLQHVTETTTCDVTKLYIFEQYELIMSEFGEGSQ